jgi:hypothetical protein
MKPKDELELLGASVATAIEQTQHQLDNMGHIMLPISVVSLATTIGVQTIFGLLPIWIPTSFILWILWCIWAIVTLVRTYISTDLGTLFRKYRKLRNKQKRLGQEAHAKQLGLFANAGAMVFLVSAVIIILVKAKVISSNADFSVWLPLAAEVLIILTILSGPWLRRREKVSDINKMVSFFGNRTKLEASVRRRLPLMVGLMATSLILLAFVYFGLPLWSLISTWSLYQTDVNGFKVFFVLALQILSYVLFSGYLTHFSARRELSNNVANLTNIDLRINQLLALDKVSADEIHSLKRQYYEAIKYRFIQDLMLGFIPVYVPILNEAYVKSNAK